MINFGGFMRSQMTSMLTRLKTLQKPIKVAIIGIGSMGKGLYYQGSITPGIETVAIADIKINKAVECAESFGKPYKIVDDIEGLHEAIDAGLLGICEDGELLAKSEAADVLLESSNAMGPGGRYAEIALNNGKHVIMMNAEADLIFGPYLMGLAQQNGLVYTSSDGDQPGVIRRLIDEIELWGFEPVIAGNIKGYMDRYVDPTIIIPEADKRNLDYKMCSSYTDGSKLCVEMALVANALNMKTAVPGMYGPRAQHVSDVFEVFDLNTIWADRQPVVDFMLGAEPKGGVFAVGYCDNEYQQSMLSWFPPDMGKGPFYIFYRPYHLCHIEAFATVAEAVLDGHSLLQPAYGFQTNVYAYAKRDLRAGDKLDGFGGYACYGLIENCVDNEEKPGLPICLAEELTLKRDIPKDQKIYLADSEIDPNREDYRLYSKAVEASKAITGRAA